MFNFNEIQFLNVFLQLVFCVTHLWLPHGHEDSLLEVALFSFSHFWCTIHLEIISVCSVRRETRYVGSVFLLPCSRCVAVGLCNQETLRCSSGPGFSLLLHQSIFCVCTDIAAFHLMLSASVRDHYLQPLFSLRIAKWGYFLVLLAGRHV